MFLTIFSFRWWMRDPRRTVLLSQTTAWFTMLPIFSIFLTSKIPFQLLFGLFSIVKYIQGLFSYSFLLTHQITIQLSLASMLVSEHSQIIIVYSPHIAVKAQKQKNSRLFGWYGWCWALDGCLYGNYTWNGKRFLYWMWIYIMNLHCYQSIRVLVTTFGAPLFPRGFF